MPTLIDTPEFAAAKDALDTTMERAEQARQRRLESVRKYLQMSEDELERVKKQALQLPTDVARYRAEIARLEATTGGDILREAMGALKAECWGTPGEAMGQPQPEAQPPSEAQPPKPHACPRCDEGMREVEITGDLTWSSPRGDYKAQEGQRLRAEAVDEVHLVLPGGWCLLLCGGSYRFLHPAVPPQSEWCDGSGKGGAE